MKCGCCGDDKPTHNFSWNQKSGTYCHNCKECGAWLFLFRKVFGPMTYPDKKRRRAYDRARYWANKPVAAAARDLYAVFGISAPKESK